MDAMRQVERDQVIAFRLDGHNLSQRRPPEALVDVAGACGVRNTPPGSATLALHARVAGLAPDAVERALADEKSLVEVLGPRSSPYVVPARDLAVFTLGVIPASDAALRASLPNIERALDESAMPSGEALRLAAAAARAELDRRTLTRGELSAGMTRRLPEALGPWCPGCKTHHVDESLFRLVGVQGVWVFAPRTGRTSTYVRADQWLGNAPETDRLEARVELLRRYLRCYGPSTAEHFAAWLGTTPEDVRPAWERLAGQLEPVALDGRRLWLHREEIARLESPPVPQGVRLLPPYDTYLDQRDRLTLLPDKGLHQRLWQPLGNPGVVLADGQIVGLWRPQKRGRRLVVTVEAFTPLPAHTHQEIEVEAMLLAPLRGSESATVAFAQ